MTVEEEPPAFHLTDVDRAVLAQTDEEFIYHDWKDLQDIIGMNTSSFSPPPLVPPFSSPPPQPQLQPQYSNLFSDSSNEPKLTPAQHEAISAS